MCLQGEPDVDGVNDYVNAGGLCPFSFSSAPTMVERYTGEHDPRLRAAATRCGAASRDRFSLPDSDRRLPRQRYHDVLALEPRSRFLPFAFGG